MSENTSEMDENRNLPSDSRINLVVDLGDYDEEGKQHIYYIILYELKSAILKCDVHTLQRLNHTLDCLKNQVSDETLQNFYDSKDNPFWNNNLVILACKHNKSEILRYLFKEENRTLCNLNSKDSRTFVITPKDTDTECHNAFYYAIRSCNTQILQFLIDFWPNDYFEVNGSELNEIISKAYSELKLKNVALSVEMEVLVRYLLIEQRFFDEKNPEKTPPVKLQTSIEERIDIIVKVAEGLERESSRVDEIFIHQTKFLAKNIHVLKRHVRSTYNKLPWEEIEFCLAVFISCNALLPGRNSFYVSILTKKRILFHLENFARCLSAEKPAILKKKEKELGKYPSTIPTRQHNIAIAQVLRSAPCFKELYNDYKQTRDMYSLEIIKCYIDSVLTTDVEESEGRLIITRALQVIGEHLKDTLETPKLSDATGELLLYSLPVNTRDVIIDLRNSLSHSESQSKRSDIKQNGSEFFSKIQNDFIKLDTLVVEILRKKKTKILVGLLNQIFDCKRLEDIQKAIGTFEMAEANEALVKGPVTEELGQLEKLISELRNKISDITLREKEIFEEISLAVKSEKKKLENVNMEFLVAFNAISRIVIKLKESEINEIDIECAKIKAEQSLLSINMMTAKFDQSGLSQITGLLTTILVSTIPRMSPRDMDELMRTSIKISDILQFELSNIKWIEEFRHRLKSKTPKKKSEEPKETQTRFFEILGNISNILSENRLLSNMVNRLPSVKDDKHLQATLEMLVLDAYSVLGDTRGYLSDNLMFFDEDSPTLIGKNLRNHLAHYNILNDVLAVETFVDTTLNASKLVAEVTMVQSKKIDKVVKDDPAKLLKTFGQDLKKIYVQKQLFSSLMEGDISSVKNCLRAGADLQGRDLNLWTALHFASKSPSLEVVKFVLDQNIDVMAKDINGYNPLHVASSYGRKDIVEFFLRDKYLSANEETADGKTALQLAIQYGHRNVVDVLMQNNANPHLKSGGHSPMRFALWYNRKEIVEILLGTESNVNAIVTTGGLTPLHIAAEKGHAELVNYLLDHNSNVHTESDEKHVPLHLASANGNVDIVKALLSKGAKVNAETIDGRTPLIFAAEMNRVAAAGTLIKHGANINVADKTTRYTPLMLSAKNKNCEMAELLLINRATVNARDFLGQSALHFAALNGCQKMAILLLKGGANIFTVDVDHSTVLHKAAEKGHAEIVRILIQKKAEVNVVDRDGRTPLHFAADSGYPEIVKVLIQAEAFIDAKDNFGSTALHLSTQSKHAEIVKCLIEFGANINGLNENKRSPFHMAIESCNEEIIKHFTDRGIDSNFRCIDDSTLLHIASMHGNKRFVEDLIKKGCDVKARDKFGRTPLHLAAEGNQKEVIELLAQGIASRSTENGFDWKDKYGHTPLYYAVKNNYKKTVYKLVKNGISAEEIESLQKAVGLGYKDIIDTLLVECSEEFVESFNQFRLDSGLTFLHVAATNGHMSVVETLVDKGAGINATTAIGDRMSSLHLATKYGHVEIVQVLISKNADINIQSVDGLTSLHLASAEGNAKIVEILLDGNAMSDIRNNRNQTPAELAVENGHLHVLKVLSPKERCTASSLLCIAASKGFFEIVKYLVSEKNADVHFLSSSGKKPIQIAAEFGYGNIVEYFLKLDSSLKEKTLLHLAVSKGHLELAKYLIAQNVDVNATNDAGLTSVHLAVINGHKNILQILLDAGAYYDSRDKLNRNPVQFACNYSIAKALKATEKLFLCKFPIDIELCVENGAFVNAKRSSGMTPLHFAAWKGFEWMVNFLIVNSANPNIVGEGGSNPLHYASKFSHLGTVRTLLANGAIYNGLNNSGKTPLDYASNEDIKNLLSLLDASFRGVQNASCEFLRRLKREKNIRSFMRAKNQEGRTLIAVAILNDFPALEQLKRIKQEDPSDLFEKVEQLMEEEKYQESLRILEEILQAREEILGSDSPGSLDIKEKMAMVLYKQQNFTEALKLVEKSCLGQKEALNIETEDTMRTKGLMAMILHRQGDNIQALRLLMEVAEKLRKILGEDHLEYLKVRTHEAVVWDALGIYENALEINREVCQKYEAKLGSNDSLTLTVRNNMGLILKNQGKKEEALKVFAKVYEDRKHILGRNHSDTLRTLHNMVSVLSSLDKWDEALNMYDDVLASQRATLGANHLDILRTQTHKADLLFSQRNYLSALKVYLENLDERKRILGPTHPEVINTEGKILEIYMTCVLNGIIGIGYLNQVHLNVNANTDSESKLAIQTMIRKGLDINSTDSNGRSLLHFAVGDNKKGIVESLLCNGANVLQVSNKGNTSLHIAASKGYEDIVNLLVDHVEQNHSTKLNDFLNARTLATGRTALHVAANIEIVKALLKHGAIYDVRSNSDQKPVDVARQQNIAFLLRITERVFKDAKSSNSQLIGELSKLVILGFSAILFARNSEGHALLDIARIAKNTILEYMLTEWKDSSKFTLR
ncbi:UNVERIFIED_CONTAM: Serine/threonine-protein phosphatase 6 regulatory ankyrin repeat subunit B [Trichonephila clavipes]